MAFLTNALFFDHLEILRALSQLAMAVRSHGVALLAKFVASSLEQVVTFRTFLSNTVVSNLLEAISFQAGNKDA